MSYKRIFKKTGRILLYILVCVFVLVCVLYVFINIPAGKRMIKNKVQSYLQDKLKTKVSIGSINYSLPNSIEINNVFVEDQKKDTLLYGEKIFVEVSMLKLIWGNTDVQKVALKNGIDISCQVSRKFMRTDMKNYDRIYAMAEDVLDDIRQITGADYDENKVRLFLDELASVKNKNVPRACCES